MPSRTSFLERPTTSDPEAFEHAEQQALEAGLPKANETEDEPPAPIFLGLGSGFGAGPARGRTSGPPHGLGPRGRSKGEHPVRWQ
jgi:hypothetical protein